MSKALTGNALVAIAAGAGLLYLLTRKGAGADGPAPASWQKSPDGWLLQGERARVSVLRLGPMTPQAIASMLTGYDLDNIHVWMNTYPADWPAEDRAPNLVRAEFRVGGSALWLEPEAAPSWIAAPAEVTATPRPTDPAILQKSVMVMAILTGMSGVAA